MMVEAYLISNVEEYGKLIAYCIEHDISVFRSYWSELIKGNRCYYIDWSGKRLFYSDCDYYISAGYEVVVPEFFVDQYGRYRIKNMKVYKE